MKNWKWVALSCLTILFATLPVDAEAKTLTVAGSSTVRPIVDQAVKEFGKNHPDTKFIIGGGGSGHGVKSAGKGEVAIGMASRAMKDSEKTEYPNVKPIKIAADGVGIVLHKKNPVTSLTEDQVRDIFTGKITNWKEVGGNDAPVVLISTGSHHGTFGVFCKHFSLEGAEEKGTITFSSGDGAGSTSADAKSVDGNKKVLAAVMTKPDSISYASLGIAMALADKGAPVKLIDLDDVTPTAENVVSGEYKFQRALFLLTDGEPEGEAETFIDFILDTPGQQLIEAEGFIPVQ